MVTDGGLNVRLKKRKRGENVPKGKGCWIGEIGKEESR